MALTSRNDPLGFAARTRKNLEYIEQAYGSADVHCVTQIANSLLGLIVFPYEKRFDLHVKDLKLRELAARGWPQWQLLKGECETLGDLIHHLRNAVAHGHLKFSSDDREPARVAIIVEDYKKDKLYWYAQIKADDLRTFCLRFIDLLEEKGG